MSLLSEANDLGTGFCRISSEDSEHFRGNWQILIFFFWSADSDQEEDTGGRRSPKPRQRSRSLRWVTCVLFYLDENECPLKFERSRVVLGLKTFDIFRLPFWRIKSFIGGKLLARVEIRFSICNPCYFWESRIELRVNVRRSYNLITTDMCCFLQSWKISPHPWRWTAAFE